MKTSYARLIKGAVLTIAATVILSACSYERTIVEKPAAAGTTVVVPDNDRKDVIVVPE